MAVYVDDMLRPALVGRVRAHWSHLLADTHEELISFAVDQLGLRPEWLQHAGTHREHFDITALCRDKALRHGAVPIDYPRGTAKVLASKKEA